MKKLIFIILTLSALSASSQLTVIRRITSQVGTIPASDTLTGTVKVDTAYSSTYKYLKYIGTTNLANTFPSGAIGTNGFMYLYIPSDSILAKVITVTAIGDAIVDTFRVQVDRVITITGSKAIKSIKAKDFGFSLQNDGGADGRVNNVVIKTGETLGIKLADIQGTSGTAWQEPVIVSAGQTSFLIIERKAP